MQTMEPPLCVLHLEDDPYDAELIHELMLADGLASEVRRVASQEDFLAALRDQTYDLILADNSIPGFDGLSALALAREIAPDAPFVFVSGTLGEEIAIESLKSGAADYVLKQRLARLGPVLRRALERAAERRNRKRAEEALRQSEAQLRALITSLDDIVFELDEVGTYLNIWTADERLLFRPRQELIGQRLEDVLDKEFTSLFMDSIRRVLVIGRPENLEYPLEVLGGQRWFMARVSPIPSPDGSFHSACLLVRDITSRKQAEEEIRLRAAQQGALNAIIIAAAQAGSSLEKLLEVALDETIRAFGLEMGNIWIDQGDSFARGLPPDFNDSIEELTQTPGLLSDRTRATPDWQDLPADDPRTGLAELMARSGVRADIVTPLWRGDETIGGLSIMCAWRREWSENEVVLLEAVGRQLGIAAERARLLENTQTRLAHLIALREIDQAISSSLDLQFTLAVIFNQVTAQLGVDATDLLLLNPYSQTLEYKAGRGFRTRAIEGSRLSLGQGQAGLAALERRTIGPLDALTDTDFQRPSLLAVERFVSYCAVPLIV
jgi:PAS domain S-box-containing protein